MAGVVKLLYTQDLKSCGRKSMRVGVPPPAPFYTRIDLPSTTQSAGYPEPHVVQGKIC